MFGKLQRPVALLQILLVLLATGCAPTQPFFLHEDGDLSHYLDAATAIEYPEVDTESLEGVLNAEAPLTLGNHDYEIWDLTLEECVAIALQNSKTINTVGGTAEQRLNLAAQLLSGNAEVLGSVYDPAIQSTTTQTQPLTIDGNGNRILSRGAIRANQVGGVEDALSEFDAQVSGFFNFNTTDRPRNVIEGNPFNPQQFQAFDSTQQLAISKRTATGGIATLRQQTIYGRNNIEPGTIGRAVSSEWTSILEAQVQHPLMRGRGALINRIPVTLASLNEDISLAEFEQLVRNLVRDVEVHYWELYRAYREVESAMVGRDSAQVTANFASLNLESGTGTAQDVAQAEGQFYQFRGQLEAALAGANLPGTDPNGVYGRERALRFAMGLESTDGRLIRPIDEPTLAPIEFDWHEVRAEALYRSPELRQQKVQIKQRELELIAAKNQLLPDVNLSMTYRWLGMGDTLGPPDRNGANFPDPGSSALAELTEGNYQEAGMRLEITPPPIGARRELARVRDAQLRLARDEELLRTKELALVNMLSDAVSGLKSHYQQTQTNFQQWAAYEREVQARLAEYEGGRAPVHEVLQSQTRRAQAQIAYYRSLVEYNKSVSYVHYLKGTLLDFNNISLREGPWPKKAYWDALERARERDASYYLDYGWTRPSVIRQGPVATSHGDAAALGETHDFREFRSEPMEITGPNGEDDPAPLPEPQDEPRRIEPIPDASARRPAKPGVQPASYQAPAAEARVPLTDPS